jgi:MFS family permease
VSPTFRSLRIHNYRLYAAGGVVSNVGTWMQRVAQDWLILQLTGGNGTALGITTGLQFLPMLLFATYGGVLADRFPKRRVLAVANAFIGLVALTLGVLVVTGAVQTWHVYVLAFLLGLGSAMENPTRQAFVSEMVGPEDLPNAVGLNSASFNGARMVGPAAAGFLIAWFGGDAASTGPVFFINAVSYLAVIAALVRMRPGELLLTPRAPRAPGQLREGIRYVTRRPDLLLIMVVVFFVGTFGLNFQITTALMATEVFGKGAGEYGALGSIMATGSLTGALLAARRGRPRLRLIIGAAMVFGVLEFVAGLMPTYWLFALSLIPIGVASLTMMTAANSALQLSVEPAMRGRVMALYVAVFMGGTPVGAPLIGFAAEHFGARWSLLVGGAVSVVATAIAAAILVPLRRSHLPGAGSRGSEEGTGHDHQDQQDERAGHDPGARPRVHVGRLARRVQRPAPERLVARVRTKVGTHEREPVGDPLRAGVAVQRGDERSQACPRRPAAAAAARVPAGHGQVRTVGPVVHGDAAPACRRPDGAGERS